MKKVSFLMAVLVAASSMFFAGCNQEPSDEPQIIVRFNGNTSSSCIHNTYVDEEVTIEVEFNVPGKIKEIRISGEDSPLDVPKTKDFLGDGFDQVIWSVSRSMKTSVQYYVEVTDKDKEENTKSVFITVNFNDVPPPPPPPPPPETPLGDTECFLFVYYNQGNPDNLNPPASTGLGLICGTTTGDGSFSNPVTARLDGSIVELSKSQFDKIETQEALQEAYNNGTKENSIRVIIAPGYTDKYFITKSGSTYSLVQTTEVDFEPPRKIMICYGQ